MSVTTGALLLAGRIVLVIFFGAVAGPAHMTRGKMMKGYAQSVGFPAPLLAGWPAGLWLIAAAVSIGVGIWPDIGALMLAAFVIPAGLYFHNFWAVEDPAQKQTQNQLFFRNLTFLGASLALFALFVAAGDSLRFVVVGPAFDF